MAAPWAGQGRPRHRIACEARNIRHTGSVLQWKRKFGWIKPDVELEHPEAFKNNWRVYVNVVDVRGQTLYSGARVSFYIYSDGKGLGAEEVFLEPRRAQEGRRGCWAGKGCHDLDVRSIYAPALQVVVFVITIITIIIIIIIIIITSIITTTSSTNPRSRPPRHGGMDHWKYVESGLWDGHFRDAASREGLVLRSEAVGLTQPPGRFGAPLQPRWPFHIAESGQSAGCGAEVPSKPGSKAAQKQVEPPSCPLQPRKSDEVPSKERPPTSPTSQRVTCEGYPKQDLLLRLSAYRAHAEQRVAVMRARLIKCPDDSSVEELAMLRAEVAAQIASLEEAAHQARGLTIDEDATGELPNGAPPFARPNFPQHPSKVPVQKTFQKDCGKKGGKKGLGLNVKVNEGKQHVAAEQEAEPDTAQTDGPVGPDRRKRTEEGSAGRLSWCSSEMRGWRPAMEDASCVCLNLEDRLANFALSTVQTKQTVVTIRVAVAVVDGCALVTES
ncbi:hypothetical protein AK812_SmicGene6687 [Symbiodinium microadriaticum]|uniref:Uncharacterized protein n=1 Tax=Symbiodinium microadriaticum TaxID=2951 RepID=A0A1Q9EQF7_SYMMI|nr:hypothetical protein AK812_SmicGene6687 [Symbiodinium microadriaticum]